MIKTTTPTIRNEDDYLATKVRVRNGMTDHDDARAIETLVDSLTWETTIHKGQTLERCRHCGGFRLFKHAPLCPAKAVY